MVAFTLLSVVSWQPVVVLMDIGKLRFSSLLIFPGFGYPGAAFLFLKFPREYAEVIRTLNSVAIPLGSQTFLLKASRLAMWK
jgi:hypothetical protein